ncbi:hypothetical protein [uncultured Friedmanniella sp.]|uniref:hypothetical protein n=1 Tax=uncultured Friedmanniella sp. TaxID=335381 RepID=UPI0035CB1A17
MTDLFGDVPPAPRRGQTGYLKHLAGQTWTASDGRPWQFWGLAPIPSRSRPGAEHVYLIRGGEIVAAVVDVNTGRVLPE